MSVKVKHEGQRFSRRLVLALTLQRHCLACRAAWEPHQLDFWPPATVHWCMDGIDGTYRQSCTPMRC